MKKIVLAALLASAAAPSFAVTITGTLRFGSPTGTNFYDPANGFVPAGYGNSSGPAVTIGNGVEFGFQDGANRDTADFTETSLTITDLVFSNASPFYMTFTSDTAGFFDNAAFSSDTFGGTLSVNGDVLSFFSPGASTPGTQTAVITFAGATADVPEPASWAMMVGGFGLMGAAMRRRKTTVRFA